MTATDEDVRKALADANDIIVAYFDFHGINSAKAAAFNILERLKEAGLTVVRAPPPSPGDPDVEVECEPFYVESDVDAEGFRTNTRLVPVASLPHSGEPVATGLRDRCKETLNRIQRDGMLRQNSPVETLMAFVQSEIGRGADPSLENTKSLILYFTDEEGREEMKAAILEAKPGMVAKDIP